MMVVIADTIFEASRRAGGLNAPQKAFGDQDCESVVHRLKRDGADLGPDDLGHLVGRDMGLPRDRAQHSQSLGGHLNTAFTKQRCRVPRHGDSLDQILE
jgi:hypothetical protein